MKKPTPFLILTLATLGGTALAVRQTTWVPLNHTPAMGHAASPSNQAITKNDPNYTVTASVTDMDTYYSNQPPNQTTTLSGYEGDVSIVTNISSSSVLSVNPTFDASTGKREKTWVLKGMPHLATQGEIQYITYTFQGVDNVSGLIHDPSTAVSQCLVALKYVSPPAPGGP